MKIVSMIDNAGLNAAMTTLPLDFVICDYKKPIYDVLDEVNPDVLIYNTQNENETFIRAVSEYSKVR